MGDKHLNFSTPEQQKRDTPQGVPLFLSIGRCAIGRRKRLLDYLFKANATFTAQATVHPTIGLLPIPRKPIISTCAGTEEEPAN